MPNTTTTVTRARDAIEPSEIGVSLAPMTSAPLTQSELQIQPDVMSSWLALSIVGWGVSIAIAHLAWWLAGGVF